MFVVVFDSAPTILDLKAEDLIGDVELRVQIKQSELQSTICPDVLR